MKPKWGYEFSSTAARDLERLPRSAQVSIVAKVVALCDDPQHTTQVKMLKGSDRLRLRVGDYRVVYTLNEDARIVGVERVRHRKEAYRGL
jgi:mRNA interferase RelE/StbE